MTARFYYSDPDLGTVELSGRVARTGWELRENAEEGSVATSTLVLDDPDMDLEITGHRRFWVIEDESEATDNVLWSGYTADQVIGRTQGDRREPLARAWTVSLVDMNAFWQKRAMMGADCKRPAETDVARMQWLYGTTEASIIADDTTYFSTASPGNMDKVDYRRQMLTQVVDDAAQVGGKNWYLWDEETGTGRVVHGWYGKDTLATRSSSLYLTNDLADIVDDELEDGTSLVWPISTDTTLRRDPGRQYDGVVLEYEKGAVYRAASPRTVYRDFVARYPNVKTKTKALARATRLLAELAEQDDVITTTVELPAAKATMIRAGMRVAFRATHLPGFDAAATFYWCRVLSCSITPVAAGERYRLTLELAPTGATVDPPPPGAVGFMMVREGSITDVGMWTFSLEADGEVVLTHAQLVAGEGGLITFPAPIHASEWRIHMVVAWDTVFMPPLQMIFAVLVGSNGTDLFGNGWDGTGRVAPNSTQTFVGTGPADGFGLMGHVNNVNVGPTYGSLVTDQTDHWTLHQTNIINNVARTLDYYWTWTLD